MSPSSSPVRIARVHESPAITAQKSVTGPLAATINNTLGATLHVGGGQRSASYSGTYAVTVAYD